MKSVRRTVGVLALLLLAAGTSSALDDTVAKPDDLELAVALNQAMKPGSIEDAMTADLAVTVRNKSARRIRGELVIGFPQAKGVEKNRLPFTLEANGEKRETVSLHLPHGKPLEMELHLSVESGGNRLIFMPVFLNKAGGWRVIGPFDGNRAEGLEKVYPPEEGPPEEGIDLNSVHGGRGGRLVRWLPIEPAAISEDGYFDLSRALGPCENATAYAFTGVHVPVDTRAVLHLGSDDGVKVWLNGELIHTHNIHRGSAPGQDVIPLDLKAGRNVFLLKISNDDGGWGFHFELKDDVGGPVPGLKTEAGVARRFIRDTGIEVSAVTGTSARLTWRSDLPYRCTIYQVEADRGRTLVHGETPKDQMIRPKTGAPPEQYVEAMASTQHAVMISKLRPGTRYLVWANPGLAGQATPAVAFYTAPAEGKTHYLVLKLAAVIFTSTTPPADQGRLGAKDPCSASEVHRVEREMAQAVLFYWITSGMRLFLDVAFFTTDTFHPGTNEAYGIGFSETDEEAYRKILKAAGRRPEEFDGRLFISMEKRFDAQKEKWFYPHSGGGTIGPEGAPGYGKSAWKGGSNNAWRFCHESQHQLDALYKYSHGPGHLFCHFQPWDDTAHRHGEHWDGIAWILLEWAGYVTREHQGRPYLEPELGYRYFLNRWGRVVTVDDADGDGIPDRDPIVPLDEARFKSDPSKKDTDGDGLCDMMEVLACHWVEYGLNEIWAGEKASHYADPARPDSDGDGLNDGVDPDPVYPIDPAIPKGEPKHHFSAFRDRAWNANFTLGWDEAFLYLGLESRKAPQNLKILLDLENDGWFMGADNYDIRVQDGVSYEPRFHHCGVEGKWPFYEEGRLETGRDLFFESEIEKDRFRIAIRVARSPDNGLELIAGERIGILIAASPEGGAGRPGEQGDLTLFEPHTFFTFTLKE